MTRPANPNSPAPPAPPAYTRLVPPDACYWALMPAPAPAPAVRRPGPLPEGLRDDVQARIPAPLDDLQVVCAPVPRAAPSRGGEPPHNTGLLVCAVKRDLLRQAEVASMHPSAVPGPAASLCPPEALEFLVGECEPPLLQRWTRRTRLLAAAGLAIVTAITALGLARRAHHWRADAAEARSRADALLALAGVEPGPLAVTALDQQVTRLRTQVSAAAEGSLPPDAASTLATILRAWPAGVSSRPRNIVIRPGRIALLIDVDGDATPFLDAAKAPKGWSALEPRVSTARGVTRVQLEFTQEDRGQ